MCNLVWGYFSELFSSPSPQDCESAVNDIDRSLTYNERQALERCVTSSEVYEALMQMDPSKAPGPDGITATKNIGVSRVIFMELEFVGFAYASIFFTRSSVQESCRLKGIFTRYCQASGQVINYENSKISFSANVDIHMRTRIIECLNVRKVVHQNKYLGLPSVIGRSKKVVFQAILDKIKKKLCGWKEKTLSIAGKEKTQFGGVRGKGCVCQSFEEVLDFVTWHCSIDLFSKSRFGARSHPQQHWQLESLRWNIGDGQGVNVWNDFWVDDHRSLGPKPNNCDVDQVSDLLNNEGDAWNHELLSSLFPHNISSKIACCFVSKSRNDVLYWQNNPGGRFSCKSTYLLAIEADEDMACTIISDDLIEFWRVVWKAKSRGLNQTSSCTNCGEKTESIVHVMFKCSTTKELSNRMGAIHDDIMGTVDEKKQTFSWPVEW
uniref:Reverse transcriptase n=1 Tax=Tanacetum cinerariifolium TaxID=118510 RepID=A0A699I368_TANCI|nr:reverse transcriptase [Tanacetum cinerariifolium]